MKIKDSKLDTIVGGASSTTLTGAIINAITNIIKVIFDAGSSAGESIRRIKEDGMCPLN